MLHELARKHTIRAASPSTYIKQRIYEAAMELNKAGQLAVRVELANEALCKLATLLYTRDADGQLANVDRVTGRLLVPAPWGSRGWKLWNLRAHEADRLSAILRRRQETSRRRPPLFVYDGETRNWTLNLADYPTFEASRFWLKHEAITLDEWRSAVTGGQ